MGGGSVSRVPFGPEEMMLEAALHKRSAKICGDGVFWRHCPENKSSSDYVRVLENRCSLSHMIIVVDRFLILRERAECM